MKRLFLSIILILISAASFAQLRVGGNFLISFSNERTVYSGGESMAKNLDYEISVYPKLYWNLNEKMNVGGRLGFSFGRVITGYSEKNFNESVFGYFYQFLEGNENIKDPVIAKISNTAISWSVNPFFAYKVFTWKILNIWIEANAAIGQAFNTGIRTATLFEWDKQLEYGLQILPVVELDVTQKFAIQFHLGFPSLMWYGETSHFADRNESTSTWTLRKGGLEGLIQGFSNYGIGLVKKF